VVIYGESGTGKELVAQTIHRLSDRRDQRFVAVNCGAIPENLFESEFFGHRKGAFTGATRDKAGFFDVAHKGTLFLDEVGELSPTMQVKLLRALESREYIPLGDQTPKHADVRIVAATNRNLAEDVRTGGIRQDFFYRINVVAITLPPLRERREDIPLLIDHVLESYKTGTTPVTLPATILAALYRYDWPGNIRELQNVLQRYLTLGRLDFADSVEPVAGDALVEVESEPHGAGLQDALDAVEKRLILNTLEAHQWHRGHTAAALGVTRRSLQRKMHKHGLM
jgi:transcriptional regulator with PAS, ATPase and Fis domain